MPDSCTAPQEYAVNFHAKDDAKLCWVEQRTLQITHAEAGAAIIERWQMDSFLADAVHLKETTGLDPAFGVLVLTGLYAVFVIITSVVGGRLSDRMGKRKPLVIASSAIIALASLILAFAPTWVGGIVGASVLGIGFGAYLAVDFALITQVLPSAAERGKDLGVINIANSLPQVIAPALAWPFVTLWGGYVSLYVAAAVIGLLGAVFVVKIKGVD